MKTKIGIFFGGNSVEHEVSIISALQAYHAINHEKYDVIPVYITKDNKMYVGFDIGNIENYNNIDDLIARSQRVVLVSDYGQAKLIKYPFHLFKKTISYLDLAFPIVHGLNVEDGTLISMFKMVNLPFVGSDIVASAVGMDKQIMKDVLKSHNMPVLDYLSFTRHDYNNGVEDIIRQTLEKFGYPLIIKPANLGSSIGITKVTKKSEFIEAIDYAFEFTSKIIIERCVVNLREINCSVLGNIDGAIASVCEEPILNHDILSYEDKYLSKGSKTKGMSSLSRKLPADISDSLKKEIQEYAIKTFDILGCSGVSRIDFILEGKKVYINEINTIPGSLSFYLWKESGIEYIDLIDRLINDAIKENQIKQKIISSFESNILSNIKTIGLKNSGKK